MNAILYADGTQHPIKTSANLRTDAGKRIIERSFDRLMHHRRLARDYERHPCRSEAMIDLAVIDLMARRLTDEATLNWRGT